MKKLTVAGMTAYGMTLLWLGVVNAIAVVVIISQPDQSGKMLTALVAGGMAFIYDVLVIGSLFCVRRTQNVLRSRGR